MDKEGDRGKHCTVVHVAREHGVERCGEVQDRKRRIGDESVCRMRHADRSTPHRAMSISNKVPPLLLPTSSTR